MGNKAIKMNTQKEIKYISDYLKVENITLEDVEHHAFEVNAESDYWESCYNFVKQQYSRHLTFLSEKQRAWLDRIIEDMIEYRIEKK